MKKTRVNLAEQYPRYFAASQMPDAFAEVGDADLQRLGLLEKALGQAAELEAEIAAMKEADKTAELQANLEEKEALILGLNEAKASLEAKVQELEGRLAGVPAAASTAVQGKDPVPPAAPKVKASVEQELDRIIGIQ